MADPREGEPSVGRGPGLWVHWTPNPVSQRSPRSNNSFTSSEPIPTMPIAQICSAERPALRSETFSSGEILFTLKAGLGRSGRVGGPSRRLPRITHL